MLASTHQLLPLLHLLEASVRSGNPVGGLAEELLEQASFFPPKTSVPD